VNRGEIMIKLISILTVIVLMLGCKSKENFIEIKSKLVWSYGEIYGVDIKQVSEKVKKIYESKKYILSYPEYFNGELICTGAEKDSEINCLLKIKNGKETELYSRKGEMFYPAMLTETKFVCIIEKKSEKEDLNYILLLIDIKNRVEKILDENIDNSSKPVINENGEILYSKEIKSVEGHYIYRWNEIYKIDKNFNRIKVTGGSYPLWEKNGKTMIYYSDKKLCRYDFTSKKSKKIIKLNYLLATPDISKDGKYMAVIVEDSPYLIKDYLYPYMKVINIETKEIMEVIGYNNHRVMLPMEVKEVGRAVWSDK
jgi:hypothetical protein